MLRKIMRHPMTDKAGNQVTWTVRHVPILGNRKGAWVFTDHTGYERFGGSWQELVARFATCAENHGFRHHLS